MGTDDIHKRKKARALSELRRKANQKHVRELILIVCEGIQTEPNYFRGFKLTNVDVHGTGTNTLSVVQRAIELEREAHKKGKIYDQVWCVFDRDSFTAARFNDAIQLASHNNFSVAYSNESFELWYILHYEFLQAALTRHDYIDRLSNLLGYRYEKNRPEMYDELMRNGNQELACRYAERLLEHHKSTNPRSNPESDKPSTTVHLLVCTLNNWIK